MKKEKTYGEREKGEAYAFLNLKGGDAPIDLDSEIRHLMENKARYNLHPELKIYVPETAHEGVHPDLGEYDLGKHIIKADLPEETHRKAAEELCYAVNLLSKGLENQDVVLSGAEAGYKENDTFHYEDNGEFHPLKKSKKAQNTD